ncbi:branched-chain amino acid ABC transporter ATP-binding protein [Verrucomicrobia bacterium LW23]|nr:branched-chain amino acid ABC transporter ATP-binding protein [Verrucomicrobia bacterium LW23]
MLKLENVHAAYGPVEVLKGINLEINPGEIVALLGANGAGKSTTLLTSAGVVATTGGQIWWEGKPLLRPSPDVVLRQGICLCPEGRHIFPRLTVKENLLSGSYLLPKSRDAAKLDRIFDFFPVLKERLQQLGGTLSGGEQQMLAIGRSLMSEPRLLMLDEPSLGLAPQIVQRIFSIIQTINKEGTPILLVEQNAREALRIAHRGYVIVTGEIVLTDTASSLLNSDEVRRAYLGEDE